jgi:mannose-6-phosphate isomerase-like protein (cupin superfamily)
MSEGGPEIVEGDGFALAPELVGEGYGFRKIRKQLGVEAFGVNAIVLPPGFETGRHFHDEQQELYFVHHGEMEMELGDGAKHRIGEGGTARVDPSTIRKVRNTSESEDLVYVVIGGKDGYVGRDGHQPDGETRR